VIGGGGGGAGCAASVFGASLRAGFTSVLASAVRQINSLEISGKLGT